jgi:hypothetical protein
MSPSPPLAALPRAAATAPGPAGAGAGLPALALAPAPPAPTVRVMVALKSNPGNAVPLVLPATWPELLAAVTEKLNCSEVGAGPASVGAGV